MRTFWVPRYKYQLLLWFKENRPDWNQSELRKKKKNELYAIFFKTRKKGGVK
ncbi:MAG: hypothetical protein ACTSPI_00820 [Candidatus Heimdallarchaeaceae archaeon]